MQPSGNTLPHPTADASSKRDSLVWIDRYIRLVDVLLENAETDKQDPLGLQALCRTSTRSQ
ncbi:MAG TPA: hypothetical protein VEG30_15750 [Terriglobales bacterium]|nr:hypothetical protein [Terriglobales bacterium]